MVRGLFPAMVDGLITSKLGSDTSASGAPVRKSPEGEPDATDEPDLDWREFLTDEVVCRSGRTSRLEGKNRIGSNQSRLEKPILASQRQGNDWRQGI